MKNPMRALLRKSSFAIAVLLSIATPARAELIISPEAITISGERRQRVSTTVTLSDDQPLSDITPVASDLRRTDGAAFIVADDVVVAPVESAADNDAVSQLKVSIDLGQASANGEFSGALYLYHEGERQVVPLLVRVKAAPVWPWVVMIAGVLLGSRLSNYRAEGRLRDEIVVRVGRLRNQMRADAALDDDFRVSVETTLVGMETALEDKDWEAAKAATDSAQDRWNLWRTYREDWIAQLAYGETLFREHYETLPSDAKDTVYMQQVKENLEAIHRRIRAGQYEKPQALQEDFSAIREQILDYKAGEAIVIQLKTLRADANLSAERDDFWREALNAAETALHNLSPDPKKIKAWRDELDEKKAALTEDIAAAPATRGVSSEEGATVGGRAIVLQPMTEAIAEAPATVTVASRSVAQAQRSLRWFNWTARTVAIFFLAWLGMIEIYSSKPAFGANPFQDYFALLAWGFGAEVTRESVLKASQDLGASLGGKP